MNVNWTYCKHWVICKIWYLARFNLEKAIFKPENESIYGTNDHLWRLKFYVMPQGTVSKNFKNSAVEEGEGSTSRSKQREGQ